MDLTLQSLSIKVLEFEVSFSLFQYNIYREEHFVFLLAVLGCSFSIPDFMFLSSYLRNGVNKVLVNKWQGIKTEQRCTVLKLQHLFGSHTKIEEMDRHRRFVLSL